MKTRIIIISILFIIAAIFIYIITIPKESKWTVDLINNYFIEKKSDTKIILGLKEENEIKIKVDSYIAEYSYGKRFILLKCLENKDDLAINYYIIDTLNKKRYGPYLEYQDYINKKDELVDEELSGWIKTIDYNTK